MIYEVKWSGKFKKGYKLAKKRGLDIGLLEEVIELTLVDTGTHSDLFDM